MDPRVRENFSPLEIQTQGSMDGFVAFENHELTITNQEKTIALDLLI